MTAVTPGPKVLLRTCIQGIMKIRKPSHYGDRQQVRSIDRNSFSFELKLLNFRE